jgi:low affinity Fe/Cu permease
LEKELNELLFMKKKSSKKINLGFDRFSTVVTKVAGKPVTFVVAFLLILAWAISGPLLNFSDTWQLMINTTTTIVTFLMVFIIQQTQNKDTMALQLKLNELIACQKKASNRLIDIEDLTGDELEVLKKFYIRLSELSKQHNDLHSSHSVDEAETIHKTKTAYNPKKSGSH